MADLGTAYFQLVPSLKGFSSAVSKELGAAGGQQAGAKVGTQFGSGFKGAVAGLGGLALVGLGVAKFTGYIKDSFAAVQNWGAINAQSASVVKATGGAAGITAQQVHNLATSLEGQTSTQAEAIQSGANMLLTFKNVQNQAGKGNDIFTQSTKVLVDMSRAMGTEPQQAAIQLGKALNDPVKGISALSRVGVTFTQQQKDQIKSLVASGHSMQAQKIILAELNSEFGGSGAAYRATFAGQMYQLGDAVGDFGESIVTAALPALTSLVGTASAIANWANDADLVGKTAAAIGTAFNVAAPLVKAFLAGFQGSGMPQISAAFTQIRAAVAPLIPAIVQAAAAFSPLRFAFMALAPVLPVVSVALTQLASALGQGLLAVVSSLAPALVSVVNAVVQFAVPLLRIPPLVQGIVIGLLAWKAVGIVQTLAASTAALAVNAAAWARNAAAMIASKAETVAIMAMYAGEFVANLVRAGIALTVQAGQWIAATAAMVAGRVAMVAGAVATGVATAAQWALNAAMSANPIALVVIAIAALVAGLIWFFTQTKLGQTIWANFTRFLTEAWNNVTSFLGTAWRTIAGFFSTGVGQVVAFVFPLFGLVNLIIQNWSTDQQLLRRPLWNVIVAGVTAMVGNFQRNWALLSAGVAAVWQVIVTIVTTYINTVRTVITTVVGFIVTAWNAYWRTHRCGRPHRVHPDRRVHHRGHQHDPHGHHRRGRSRWCRSGGSRGPRSRTSSARSSQDSSHSFITGVINTYPHRDHGGGAVLAAVWSRRLDRDRQRRPSHLPGRRHVRRPGHQHDPHRRRQR
jgi:hypothetical protein